MSDIRLRYRVRYFEIKRYEKIASIIKMMNQSMFEWFGYLDNKINESLFEKV